DRGSEDSDNWGNLQNPGWDWEGLLPYFRKSSAFTPPSEDVAAEYGYTYEPGAYGTGPIQASYPPFQYPGQKLQWNAWLDLNISVSKEGADGTTTGHFWIPTNADPNTETRSYAMTKYYEPTEKRTNYHLLPGHKVREVVFGGLVAEGVTFEARDGGANKTIYTVKARKEIILAAGTFNSPLILQRSGVGPRELLERAGIEVKVDLPGVGQNLQDHGATLIAYAYGTDLEPNPTTSPGNATFIAEAQAEYDQNRTGKTAWPVFECLTNDETLGPLTVGLANSVVFLPLLDFYPNITALTSQIVAQDLSTFLPSTYDATLLAGFEAQKTILLASYQSNSSAMLELFFNGNPVNVVVLQKPLSRGIVTLNTSSPFSDPVVDPMTFMNPADLQIDLAMMRFARKWYAAPSMAPLNPFETVPGSSVVSDEDLIAAIRTYSIPSIGHGMGTNAMMPRELGGVVAPDLLVYGVKGVSVADASVIPLAPATHSCSTVYAIAEKAADIIKSRALKAEI
ncbi:Dehydrogenase xptC, partial [Lachnellula suecica]